MVVKRDINASAILEIAVLSDEPLGDVYSKANNIFKERLQRADGVSEVELHGGRDKEDRRRSRPQQTALLQPDAQPDRQHDQERERPPPVRHRLRRQDPGRPSGWSPSSKTPEEIAKIKVPNVAGVTVPLKDVASIKEQEARVNRYSRTNGADAVSLSVYMNSDANIVNTAKNAPRPARQP